MSAAQPPVARFSICVLEDAHSRLLFLHRADDRPLGPGKWGFPAGHIEDGESAEDCAAREMREEIGDSHVITELQRLGPIRDSLWGGIYELHLFHYRWHHGTVQLNHEHVAYAWLGPGEHRALPVMDGIDEDIRLLGVWPLDKLNAAQLPATLGGVR